MKLKGKGFILRHIKMSDVAGYFKCQQDKNSREGLREVPETISEAKKELKRKIADLKKRRPFGECFAIEVNKEFAGYIELCHLNKKFEEHKGSIGYCMHPKFRGRGIMTEAVRLLTDYAFKKYKLKRMWGQCRAFNKASARVLEKAGYKLEGIKRKDLYKNGKCYDNMLWAKIK